MGIERFTHCHVCQKAVEKGSLIGIAEIRIRLDDLTEPEGSPSLNVYREAPVCSLKCALRVVESATSDFTTAWFKNGGVRCRAG
jgi:hypothetical protein